MKSIDRRTLETDIAKVQQLWQTAERNPLVSAFRGYIFESHVLELLEQGNQFTCRLLSSANQGRGSKKKIVTMLSVLPSERKVVDKILPTQNQNQDNVPKGSKFDAGIPGIGAFHITKIHDSNPNAINNLSVLEQLYCLLTAPNSENFTSSASKDIDQYTVVIH